MGVRVKRVMRVAAAVVLVIASSSAAALGLGQIKLKSKLGEPLLAEIPIVSSDPSELENLSAGLASPETFARIGLQLPQGIVAELRFVPAVDSAGRPVIRVTSAMPIEEPLLTFLVEVDWGQGRLVREYSTLLDAPRTVAASVQPSIQTPQLAPSNVIVRDGLSPDTSGADAAREAGATSGATDSPDPDEAESIAASSVQAAPSPSSATRYGAIQRGERLSVIAAGLEMDGNLQQRMVALLQANPQAFIDGNINLLKQGAVLRIPDADEIAAIGAAQAAAHVREQNRAWRTASQPVPQPQVSTTGVTDVAEPSTSGAPDATASADGARLEIIPPGASDASRAGTQSGISAGGEGDMVRQELQVTKETLAARDAELAELKSRIDTLEQLQTDQQKLLSMKDSELASAQQQLAQSQSADPLVTGSATPWLLGGTGLVLVLIGGWWMRRRADIKPRFRAPETTTAVGLDLASGFPSVVPEPAAETDSIVLNPKSINPQPMAAVDPIADTPAVAETANPARNEAPAELAKFAVPAWHASAGKHRLNKVEPAPVADTEVPGMDRLELARAYLDLGDHDSARQLLGELTVNGGLEARQQATRLLRELG